MEFYEKLKFTYDTSFLLLSIGKVTNVIVSLIMYTTITLQTSYYMYKHYLHLEMHNSAVIIT